MIYLLLPFTDASPSTFRQSNNARTKLFYNFTIIYLYILYYRGPDLWLGNKLSRNAWRHCLFKPHLDHHQVTNDRSICKSNQCSFPDIAHIFLWDRTFLNWNFTSQILECSNLYTSISTYFHDDYNIYYTANLKDACTSIQGKLFFHLIKNSEANTR